MVRHLKPRNTLSSASPCREQSFSSFHLPPCCFPLDEHVKKILVINRSTILHSLLSHRPPPPISPPSISLISSNTIYHSPSNLLHQTPSLVSLSLSPSSHQLIFVSVMNLCIKGVVLHKMGLVNAKNAKRDLKIWILAKFEIRFMFKVLV